MATVKHLEWINGMLGATTTSVVDLNTDNIDASLLDQTDSGAITNATAVYDTVDGATVVATGDVPAITVTNGVCTVASAMTFTSVTGDAADYLTVFKNSGNPATSPLIITWDSATTGLPVTPNGGNIVVTWGTSTLVTLA